MNTMDVMTLNERSRETLRHIVESYIATGEPVGSRHLSRSLPMGLSPASIRNIMSDLELMGLIYAPHTSAGRLPTEMGLRFFVDALLEVGDLSSSERTDIEAKVAARGELSVEHLLHEAGQLLSGLSGGASVVATTKHDLRLKHIEFVRLDPVRALVIMVGEDNTVENRLIDLPRGLPASALVEAGNFLNARLRGRTIHEARADIEAAFKQHSLEVDDLTKALVDQGLASWAVSLEGRRQLIVRGQSKLLDDAMALQGLEKARMLLEDLEEQKDMLDLLSRTEGADGVRIFIGSENKLFSLSGSSVVTAPFHDKSHNVVGVLGVIGPTRLNYARIVPMVDYTARVINRLLERSS
jgi:heat-inducible transcriptional repressor